MACVQLINTIVLTPDDLDFRLHLRNEFMRVGLADLLDVRTGTTANDLVSMIQLIFTFCLHPVFNIETGSSRLCWFATSTQSFWRASRWGLLWICTKVRQYSHGLGWHGRMFWSATQFSSRHTQRTLSPLYSTAFTFHPRWPQCQVSYCHKTKKENKIRWSRILTVFFFPIVQQGLVLQTYRRVYRPSCLT